jgi:two-component system chemotaxis response regulator CheY
MGNSDSESLKILVVDDDAASRGLMQVLLSEYGQCDYATNGIEAVEAFTQALDSQQSYDLICLDIMMPEMDGLESLKKIREVEQSYQVDTKDCVKVIMTTAANQVSKTMKAFHHGCSGYLIKPISKEALVKEINKLPLAHSSNAQWRNH